MDESFSDFQEKKQYTTGPKHIQKAKPKVVKKKPLKSRAQKDIRTYVKCKENDLVSYSKDFDKVCKKNGLDVDSEQLQLAIALSKSLQSSSDGNNSKEGSTSLSSQERSAKIRLTLQEYGFKIPNKKLNTDINRRRKCRKQYKLLLTSDEEKKQIILDKYSEVLAINVHKSPKKDNSSFYNNQTVLYHKATSIPFECIKNNETFYVKDLHFEILHDICLLRDWSNIPGRPSSPMREKKIHFNFNEINFTQEELDYILSGSLNTTQDIVKNKNIGQIQISQTTMDVENISTCIDNVEVENVSKIINTSKNLQTKDVLRINEIPLMPKTLSITQQVRSVSPDIFDDDLSLVCDKTSTKEASFNLKEQTVFMDLTECVADVNNGLFKTDLYMSHEENTSKRKSNDFMEITECAPLSSKQSHIEEIDLTQGYIPKKLGNNKTLQFSNLSNLEKMDLTQSSNSDIEDEPEVVVTEKNQSLDETIIINDDVEHFPVSAIDISCSSKNKKNQEVISIEKEFSSDDLNFQDQPEVIGDCSKATEDIIAIEHNVKSSPTYNYTDHVFEHSYIYDCDNFNDDNNQDLGWSSDQNNDIKNDTQGELLEINDDNNSKGEENSKGINKYPTIIESDKDINFANNSVDISKEINVMEKDSSSTNNMSNHSASHTDITKDLVNVDYDTEKMNSISETSKDIYDHESIKDYTENEHNDLSKNNIPDGNNENLSPIDNYNDYVFEHSYIHDHNEINSPVLDKNNDNDEDKIDLTQSSDVDSIHNYENNDNVNTEHQNSLGKKDNISIDYDEIIDLENKIDDNNLDKSISEAKESTDVSSSSKHSEVFELSDTEFNYSLHQSRFSNYDDDGFDDISKESGKRSSSKLNRSMSESDLNKRQSPKRKRKSYYMSQNTTPIKDFGEELKGALTQTPASNGYIIKTRDVTPMADYASMSSPERNEELKRYGLKPFKRKRAIQLLTYLYNQTHPVVESCDIQECASPAKKAKYNTGSVQKSPKKSPRKSLKYSKSPIKSSNLVIDAEKENLLYIQTKDVPDIKEIDSEPEDWVFQTREKAKVHSCRVPLHIAFHNYVSCRRYLRESILKYEPVNIDVIHKELVSIGYRYNPKDLLKFMDKKCITVKTVDNNARKRK